MKTKKRHLKKGIKKAIYIILGYIATLIILYGLFNVWIIQAKKACNSGYNTRYCIFNED